MPNASSASRKFPDLPELTAEQLRQGELRNAAFIRLAIEYVRAHAGEPAAQDLIRKLTNGWHG